MYDKLHNEHKKSPAAEAARRDAVGYDALRAWYAASNASIAFADASDL